MSVQHLWVFSLPCVFAVGKVRMGGCPSPATAARMMPPPSTGRFLRPPPAVLASHAALHTSSTPRPQQRKKRRRAAQQGHVLLTQESPGSGSPDRASLPGEHALPRHYHMLCHIMLCHVTLPQTCSHYAAMNVIVASLHMLTLGAWWALSSCAIASMQTQKQLHNTGAAKKHHHYMHA